MNWPVTDLGGHLALVLQVLGQVDDRHAALTKLALDRVAAFQGCVQAFGRIRHEDKMRVPRECRQRDVPGAGLLGTLITTRADNNPVRLERVHRLPKRRGQQPNSPTPERHRLSP